MEHEIAELNDSGRVYFNGYFKQAIAADPGDVASVASRKRWARALLQDCVRASLEWQEREAVARRSASDQPPLV